MSSRRRSLAPAIDDGYSASTAFAETATGWHCSGSRLLPNQWHRLREAHDLPRRSLRRDPGWVCFGLRLEHHAGTSDFRVRVKFTFLDNAGNLLPRSMISGTTFYIDSIRGDSWCEVTVLGNVDVEVSAVVPPSDLHRHLGDLLSTGVGADVAFDVAGETFAAHRAVLATRFAGVHGGNSSAALSKNLLDTCQDRWHRAKVFEALLYFIYNDALNRRLTVAAATTTRR
ncbi:hypothetical protein HU200_044067 [Digitaria exilis]|uniref:BTB domain-containing protein n=1 Tax=Digitaria exilis TaxID=1010633 RepID=A0A835AZK7_9POAL|nr:hypothetical protein HU200_044067 [Digitaria exilis]